MRAVLAVLALPVALCRCGSKQDLIIGELWPAGAANVGAAAGAGGASYGGASGTSGANSEAGDGGTGVEPIVCPTVVQPSLANLVHRYSFDGTGTTAVDSVGDKDATLQKGAVLDGSGVLNLPGRVDGVDDQYAELPAKTISVLTDMTVLAWVTWNGGAGFQRIFDFGESTSGVGQGDQGKSYIAMITSTNFANGNRLGVQLAMPGFSTLSLGSNADMIEGTSYQVALVFQSGQRVALYRDGALLIESPTNVTLAMLNDVNDWIGRSQWVDNHGFGGTYAEFRIYDAGLDACQIAALRDQGPDVP
jgi:Concanavalin A-like lectin/glucanases superfamily